MIYVRSVLSFQFVNIMKVLSFSEFEMRIPLNFNLGISSRIESRISLIIHVVIVYIERRLSLGRCNAYNFIICIKENCLIGVKHRK